MTATDTLTDAHLRRSVKVSGYARGQQKAAVAVVDAHLPGLRAAISDGLDGIKRRGPASTPWERKRFVELQATIDHRAKVMALDLRDKIEAGMRGQAKQDADWALRAASKAGATLKPLDKRTVGSIANEPMAGRTLTEWAMSMGKQMAFRMKSELAIGLRKGESNQALQSRMLKAMKNAEWHAAAIAATGVRHVHSQVKQRLAQQNEDAIRGLMWVATLEVNTCIACRALHGRVFKVDVGPRPPKHVHCYCDLIPVLKGEPDPEVLDADDWLRAQTTEFQDEALGPARAKLWREGGVGSIRDLTNMRGRVLTLAELEERD